MVAQIGNLFHTTHKVKTQRVVRNRGQRCGDIEIVSYLTNETGPVPLVLDLRIAHDRSGSSSDPSINGHLHYPSLLCLLLLVRPGGYTVNLCGFYFYKLIGKLTASLQLQEFS